VTGWDIGLVPPEGELAPYPYEGGIEVWLARDKDDARHSDFWRAEPTGRFSIFRGYQEDMGQYPKKAGQQVLDFTVTLWRVAELLIYIRNFSRQLRLENAVAMVGWTWNGAGGQVFLMPQNENS